MNPVPVMQLVELIRGNRDGLKEKLCGLPYVVEKLGKTAASAPKIFPQFIVKSNLGCR